MTGDMNYAALLLALAWVFLTGWLVVASIRKGRVAVALLSLVVMVLPVGLFITRGSVQVERGPRLTGSVEMSRGDWSPADVIPRQSLHTEPVSPLPGPVVPANPDPLAVATVAPPTTPIPLGAEELPRTQAPVAERPDADETPAGGASPLDLENAFRADVYASVRSAVVATARELLKSLDQVIPDGTRLNLVQLSGDVQPGVLAAVERAIRPSVGSARIEVVPGQQPLPTGADGDGTVRITADTLVTSHRSESSEGRSRDWFEYELRVSLAGSASRLDRSVKAVDKLWVEDLNAYRGQRGAGPGEFIVVRTPSETSDPQQALRQTMNAAAKLVFAYAAQELGKQDYRFNTLGAAQAQTLRDRIDADLARGRLVADRFSQRFDRPYGPLYREALLLDVSGRTISSVVREYQDALRAREASIQFARTTRQHTFFSVVGLSAMILVVYLFLNAATRGYYVWSLRIASVLLIMAGVFVVMSMA